MVVPVPWCLIRAHRVEVSPIQQHRADRVPCADPRRSPENRIRYSQSQMPSIALSSPRPPPRRICDQLARAHRDQRSPRPLRRCVVVPHDKRSVLRRSGGYRCDMTARTAPSVVCVSRRGVGGCTLARVATRPRTRRGLGALAHNLTVEPRAERPVRSTGLTERPRHRRHGPRGFAGSSLDSTRSFPGAPGTRTSGVHSVRWLTSSP